jgi:hypothetical protein
VPTPAAILSVVPRAPARRVQRVGDRKDKRRNRTGPVPGAIPGCETLLRICRCYVNFPRRGTSPSSSPRMAYTLSGMPEQTKSCPGRARRAHSVRNRFTTREGILALPPLRGRWVGPGRAVPGSRGWRGLLSLGIPRTWAESQSSYARDPAADGLLRFDSPSARPAPGILLPNGGATPGTTSSADISE